MAETTNAKSLVAALAISLLIASAALAQQKNDVSVFANITDSGTRSGGGLGLSFARMLAPDFSVQLAVAGETHRTYPYVVGPNGSIVDVASQRVRTYPIDLAARYHWSNDTRWKPYLGLGIRYIAAPNVDAAFGYGSHVNPEIVGGVAFLVRPTLGITLDGRQLTGIGSRENYDPLTKVSLGVSWRF